MLQTRLKSGLQPCPTCCMHQALPACGRWSQQASQQQHRSSSANCPSHPASSRRQRRQRGSLLISAAVKITTDKNVVCSKTLVGIPGQEKTLFRLCKDITKFSQQRMSDRQSGILSFECSQDNWDPNVVHFWERYVGNAKLGAHSTSPEMQKFMEKVLPPSPPPPFPLPRDRLCGGCPWDAVSGTLYSAMPSYILHNKAHIQKSSKAHFHDWSLHSSDCHGQPGMTVTTVIST